MGARATSVLELELRTKNFSAGRTAFQGLATDAKGTSGAIRSVNTDITALGKSTDAIGSKIKQNVTTPLKEVEKTSTSVGAKMKNFGKSFAGTITSAGALSGQVFNLSRQYQDLSDTQIRVDRTALKMSKTKEAQAKAEAKLQDLVKKGITSGAEYEQALLDVQQTTDAATLAVTMNGEALEDQQRAYENFAMNLAPTVVSAGSTIVNMFKEMGGTKGFGGLKTKIIDLVSGGAGGLGGLTGALKNAEGGAGRMSKATQFLSSNMTSLIGVLGGVAGAFAIIELGTAAQNVFDKMSNVDVSKKRSVLEAAFGNPEQIKLQSMGIAEFDAVVKNADISLWDYAYDALFGTSKVQDAAKSAGILDERNKLLKESVVAAMDLGKDFKMSAKDYMDTAYNMLQSNKSLAEVSDYLTKESLIPQEKAVVILDAALSKYNLTLKETGQAYSTLNQALGPKAIQDVFMPPNTQQAILKAGATRLLPSGQDIIGYMDKVTKEVADAHIQQDIMKAIFGDAAKATGPGEAFGAYGEKAAASIKEKMKNLFEGELFDPTFGDKLAEFGAKGTAAFAANQAAADKLANSIRYLDANFKPLNISIQQEEDALAGAEAALKAHTLATDTTASGIDKAQTSLAAFLKSTQEEVAGIDTWKTGLTTAIQGVARTFGEEFKPNAAYTIDQLKQLYEAALQGKTNFDAANKSIKATNVALMQTGKAAAVAYGALIPGDKKYGIPKGGRSGKLRVRSDYVQPLIGSPQAQREMVLGFRPDTYARGSAEIAKLASKIGDTMVKEAAKTKTAAQTMNTAFNNIITLPAVKKINAGTTAIGAISKAMMNIPKQTTPKVTAQVTGLGAVVAMNQALRNIPKGVDVKAAVRQNNAQYNALRNAGFRGGQHGYQGTVKRPTMFLVGEGGRPEDVIVKPRGSAGGGNISGGSQRNGTVSITIIPQEFARFMKATMTWGDDTYR